MPWRKKILGEKIEMVYGDHPNSTVFEIPKKYIEFVILSSSKKKKYQ